MVEPAAGPLAIESVGGVLSNTTDELLLVVAVTKLGFPAESVREILNGTRPSVSLACIVVEAIKLLPVVVATFAARPAIVTAGVRTGSLAVKESVTVSPILASVVDALFDEIETAEMLGGVVSVKRQGGTSETNPAPFWGVRL